MSYLGSTLLFTFTKDGYTTNLGRISWDAGNTAFQTNYANAIAGFFADGAKLACGISTAGSQTNNVTATYACSVAEKTDSE